MTTAANLTTPRHSNLSPQSQAPNILLKKESLPQLTKPIALSPNQAATPRTPSIRFAPLPDPRASRANVPGRLGQLDVWWSREEKPDGTWGDYRLVLRRPNGQIVAIDDLEPGSDERTQALESYRQQQTSRPVSSPLGTLTRPSFWDSESRPNSTLFGTQSISPCDTPNQSVLGKLLLPALSPQTSNLTNSSSNSNLHSAGSNASSNPLTLTPTASCDSTHSNFSFPSNHKTPSSSSLAKKFLDAMKKPITKHSHHLTPTNSLPMNPNYLGGEPLCKTRSAESTTGSLRKKFHFGLPKASPILRRTRSKEESSYHDSMLAFDEPPVRRRSNYPPVAQRKAHMGGGRGGAGKIVLAEEPDFVEWKPAAAAVSSVSAASLHRSEPAVEDDGSGMAWLRRRKKQREERAQQEEEERAQVLGSTSKSGPLATIDETKLAPDDMSKEKTIEDAVLDRSASRAGDLDLNPEEKKDDDRESSASSIYQSSILSRDGAQASGGTRTSTSSATPSSKDFNADEDEDLNEEELKEEERLKALALSQSPFVKGASEVYRDREHHQILRKSTDIS